MTPKDSWGQGQECHNKLNSLWPKIHCLGPPCLIPKSPRKCLCGSFLRSFPVNEASRLFFWGPKMFWGEGKKFMFEFFMCLFRHIQHEKCKQPGLGTLTMFDTYISAAGPDLLLGVYAFEILNRVNFGSGFRSLCGRCLLTWSNMTWN